MVTLDSTNARRYYGGPVIRSFRDRETERVWGREHSKRLPGDIQERALMKLQQLHAASDLKDLSIPASNQLEALKGDRKGEYSIRINKQWRICFKWDVGHASDVEITDYH
jgi:proteic killer suppression protein